jgi:hypothetical protein
MEEMALASRIAEGPNIAKVLWKSKDEAHFAMLEDISSFGRTFFYRQGMLISRCKESVWG